MDVPKKLNGGGRRLELHRDLHKDDVSSLGVSRNGTGDGGKAI